jgi:hypothetical protein
VLDGEHAVAVLCGQALALGKCGGEPWAARSAVPTRGFVLALGRDVQPSRSAIARQSASCVGIDPLASTVLFAA